MHRIAAGAHAPVERASARDALRNQNLAAWHRLARGPIEQHCKLITALVTLLVIRHFAAALTEVVLYAVVFVGTFVLVFTVGCCALPCSAT